MASISTDKNGNRRILFVDPDGRRRPVRLGKLPMKAAATIKHYVELLLAAKTAGCGWDAETARWVVGLNDELAAKLAAVDLIPPRERATLGEFLDRYIRSRGADAKPSTITNLRQAERYLVEFFGATKRLNDVAPGDAGYKRAIGGAIEGAEAARKQAQSAAESTSTDEQPKSETVLLLGHSSSCLTALDARYPRQDSNL